MADIKFGFGQIGQPPPPRLKWWVNFSLMVILPFIASFLLIVPDGLIDPLISGFIGKLLPLLGGALKVTEKLIGDSSQGNYNQELQIQQEKKP